MKIFKIINTLILVVLKNLSFIIPIKEVRSKFRKDIKLSLKLNKLDYNLEELQKDKLRDIQKKDSVNVVFLVYSESMWQYDLVYKMMENDNSFNPSIIIIPDLKSPLVKDDIRKAYRSMSQKYNNVYSSLESEDYIDLLNILKTDIIFFTTPYSNSIDCYNIESIYNKYLTCYVPYGIMSSNITNTQYNLFFHNVIWKCFYETDLHKKMAIKFSRNKGVNVNVTGFPRCDLLLDNSNVKTDLWPINNKNIKRIIWAPHYTIKETKSSLGYSNFLEYSDFFLSYAKDNNVQIIFKPHPFLKRDLYLDKNWGKEKTDNYYKQWESEKNTSLNESEYIDLFLSSDLLVFDSGSFMTEYLFTGKPSIFMIKSSRVYSKFNSYGKSLLDILYKSHSENELKELIDKLLNGLDDKKTDRKKFLNEYFIKDGIPATENIINILKNNLKK